jgi:syntaxin 5
MCDRTLDFNKVVTEQRLALGNSSQQQSEKKSNTAGSFKDDAKSREAFHQITLDVSKGIQVSAQSLTKLTKLVKQQGLFDDPTEEINKLIYKIKLDLNELNQKCDAAQQNVEERKRVYGDRSQVGTHSNNVVSQLKTGLMAATKDFKTALEIRSSKMKDTQSRKSQIAGNGMLSPLRQFAAPQSRVGAQSEEKMTALPTPYNRSQEHTPVDGSSMYSQSPHTMQQQQQQQLLLAPPASLQYFEGREVAVSEVEKTIGELGTLFRRLGAMIMEQQELIERIDEDVESAVSTADKAHQTLLKTYDSVSSNTALYTKLMSILALFIIFFVIFLM